jgi:hypothetical protein
LRFHLSPDAARKEEKNQMSKRNKQMNQVCVGALLLAIFLALVCQTVALAQNLGAAPQFDVAVQGQTGAQPEGAFLNFVNWVGNVIAPVGAGVAVVGGVVQYASGRGYWRWAGTALMLLLVSGGTRLLEFFITNGVGGVK